MEPGVVRRGDARALEFVVVIHGEEVGDLETSFGPVVEEVLDEGPAFYFVHRCNFFWVGRQCAGLTGKREAFFAEREGLMEVGRAGGAKTPGPCRLLSTAKPGARGPAARWPIQQEIRMHQGNMPGARITILYVLSANSGN